MKGMKSADEFSQAPLPGTYWSNIVTAESKFAKESGASMIKLVLAINDTRFPQYKDVSCDDHMITDGGAKGGGMGKTKLRGLGIDVDSSDADVADEAICSMLQGKGVWVTYGNEQRMTRNGDAGPFNIPMDVLDTRTGHTVKLMKLNVKGYSLVNVGQAQAAPAQQNTAPQGAPYAQPPAQQQPQQYAQQPQFAPPPQQGFAPAPGFAPPQQAQQQQQQYAQPPAQQAPQGQQYAQPGGQQYIQPPPGQQMQQAQPPWQGQGQPPGQPNGAPPPSAAPRARRVKGQVDDKTTEGQGQSQ